jgi:predicted amidohydrolase
MKVAMVQMVSGADVGANLASAARWIQEAADSGAELVVLPEYFCLIGSRDEDKLAVQEALGEGPIQQALAAAAHKAGVWLVGGTIPLTSEVTGRVFNTTLVFNPQGQVVARYDKMHLFRFDNGVERYDEARVLEAGSSPALFALPSADGHTWQVGLSVCYDLRFPEFYRHYAAQGADLLLVPAAFTYTTGQAHWEVLLRARAIENLAYVGASAQGGTHPSGRKTWGQSLVIDPWGQMLGQQAQGEGLVLAELDSARVAQCRTQLPALQHRRVG